MSQPPLEHARIQTNGIMLHTVQAGPVDGPVVILLHGFPEFWYCWHHQIPALASAGFRVIAPDMRGYHLSEKPRSLAAYSLNELAADVIGLIDALGRDQVYLVGHDWGGVVAWWTARNYPERIAKLAILNAPHTSVFGKFLRTHPTQMLRSWYMGFFQLPLLPELLCSLLWIRPPTPGFSPADLAEYRKAIRQPRALTCMINYYRAGVRIRGRPRTASRRITMPTLILWGKHDLYLDARLAALSADLCDHVTVEMLDTSHWIQHDAPEIISARLIEFFS